MAVAAAGAHRPPSHHEGAFPAPTTTACQVASPETPTGPPLPSAQLTSAWNLRGWRPGRGDRSCETQSAGPGGPSPSSQGGEFGHRHVGRPREDEAAVGGRCGQAKDTGIAGTLAWQRRDRSQPCPHPDLGRPASRPRDCVYAQPGTATASRGPLTRQPAVRHWLHWRGVGSTGVASPALLPPAASTGHPGTASRRCSSVPCPAGPWLPEDPQLASDRRPRAGPSTGDVVVDSRYPVTRVRGRTGAALRDHLCLPQVHGLAQVQMHPCRRCAAWGRRLGSLSGPHSHAPCHLFCLPHCDSGQGLRIPARATHTQWIQCLPGAGCLWSAVGRSRW